MKSLFKFKSLKRQRGMTDKSLISERVKTDDTFAEQRSKTESSTNAQLKDDRREADLERTSNRNHSDAALKLHRTGKGSESEKLADRTLERQRLADDAAVRMERKLVDKALSNERLELRDEVNKLLEAERLDTDKNLFSERSLADNDFAHSSERLRAEQTFHIETKAQLNVLDVSLAIVSHDLRSPIGSILSFADLALEEKSELSPALLRCLNVIKRNAQTSLRLIGAILDMESFNQGKLHLQTAPVNFDELIRDIVENFRQAAIKEEITIEIEPNSAVGTVLIDGDRLRQVISNLVGNALKFTPKGGRVFLRATKDAKQLTVSLRDTGPGIPAEECKKIFERYSQIRDEDHRGLGLGLYIAAIFVQAHQGKIWVDSKINEGSKFTFTIPLTS